MHLGEEKVKRRHIQSKSVVRSSGIFDSETSSTEVDENGEERRSARENDEVENEKEADDEEEEVEVKDLEGSNVEGEGGSVGNE